MTWDVRLKDATTDQATGPSEETGEDDMTKLTFPATSCCEGKKAFDDPAFAWKAARRRKGRAAYRCDYCGFWHVGGNVRAARTRKALKRSARHGKA